MPTPVTRDQVKNDLWNYFTDYEEEVTDSNDLVELLTNYVMDIVNGNFTPYIKKGS